MASELNGFIAQLLHRARVISRRSLSHYLLLDLVVDVRDSESVTSISGILVELAVNHHCAGSYLKEYTIVRLFGRIDS